MLLVIVQEPIEIEEGEPRTATWPQEAVKFPEESMQLVMAQAPSQQVGAITEVDCSVPERQVKTIGIQEIFFSPAEGLGEFQLVPADERELVHQRGDRAREPGKERGGAVVYIDKAIQ